MATRNGTLGNDRLTGTASADSLFGFAGNDNLQGLAGSDSLFGGTGRDLLFGGTGNFSDYLDGGDGEDILRGNEGNDNLIGGAGDDQLFGDRGNDNLLGGTGNDNLLGGTGNDNLIGDIGNDRLIGDTGNDRLNGGDGNDILTGSTTNVVGERDTLTGGTGADLFILGDATQVFYDDRNTATAGRGDYALVTDFNTNNDVIQLKGNSGNYVLGRSPGGLPAGTAIYLNKSGSEPDELIAIVQGSTSLSLDGDYFNFTGFSLSDLNGSNGFQINGIDSGDFSGSSVSSAGDVNGDGFDDLIIGAIGADPNGQYRAGESYVVFGKAGGFSANLNLSALNGSNGFQINGINEYDFLGLSVSSAGNVNGDGFDDLIIGAGGAASAAGSSYVVFGKAGGFSANLNRSDLNGSNGFQINGIGASDQSGDSVSSAGDVNGDGFDDLLIGADRATPNGQDFAGESYVVFGKAEGFSANLNLSDLNGSNGFQINGIGASDRSGASVSSAGDVNGDGFDDLIIGADGADPNGQDSAGSSYVVFGSSGGFSVNFNLSDLNGSNGFVINGIDERDYSGRVSSAGDVNGDGFDDLIIGASGADPNGQNEAGSSYVVFGKAGGFSANLNLSALNGSNGFVINGIDAGDRSGASVSSAGDVNGDGFDDILIGARYAAPNGQSDAGESYVVFGKAGGFSANLNLSALNDSNGFQLNGINEFDRSGGSVSSAGDVNGDGFDDILIGAFRADPNGQSDAGESYVIFGRADFTAAALNVGTLEPFDQLLVSNTGNAVMSIRQDWTLGSTTTADNIFFDPHNAGVAPLLGGTDITQMIT